MKNLQYIKTINLEDVVKEFMEDNSDSWTWEKLTGAERQRFENLVKNLEYNERVKGDAQTRWDFLDSVYYGFLVGLGYDSLGWRED